MSADLEQKARFEKWCASFNLDCRKLKRGSYVDDLTHASWNGWQAAERSVVSDIVGRLEAEAASLRAKCGYPGDYCYEDQADILVRQVAELKKEYLEK